MQISGHKNVASINNYSTLSEERHKKISNILSNTETVSGHLGTEHMRHLGTRYWTSRYSVLDISVLEILVLNNKNNLIEFKNFLNPFFTCRRCLNKFLCVFFNHL